MAQSLNGYISGPNGHRVQISSPEDRERVLKLREASDGILVGSRTIENDNPELSSPGNPSLRKIVIDPGLKLGNSYKIMKNPGYTIMLNSRKEHKSRNSITYLDCGSPFDLNIAMAKLNELGIKRLLIEGGEFTAQRFLLEGMVDELYIFVGNMILPESGRRFPTPLNEIRNVILDVRIMKGGILLKIDPSKFKEE